INPIGHHWKYQNHLQGLFELQKRFGEEEGNIFKEKCTRLIENMFMRLVAMIKVKGGSMKHQNNKDYSC
ncbi:hypothetical protein EDB19DRAFT_1638198, partial [Suillus lakei]